MKKKQISEKEGEKYAESIFAIFSKTSSDIKNLFENIVLKMIDIKEQRNSEQENENKEKKEEQKNKENSNKKVKLNNAKKKKRKCC